MQIQISSQLIWIYIVCKGRVYPGSAGQGLIIMYKKELKAEYFDHYIDARGIKSGLTLFITHPAVFDTSTSDGLAPILI